jgi:hypothetical protein
MWVILLHQQVHGMLTINESKKVNATFLYCSQCTKRKKVSLHLPNDVFPTTLGNAKVMA